MQENVLPCTPPNSKPVCSPAEVNTHRRINLDHTPQSAEIQRKFDELCKEYKEIFSLHQGDLGHY